MFPKIKHFIQYNNAIPIISMFVFMSVGITFAASEEVREVFISTKNVVRSVDNSYIRVVNLDDADFGLEIKEITEDQKNYYIVYSFQTIAIADYVWQDVLKENTLTVSKEVLAGGDLGVYVSKELGEVLKHELSYLREVQQLENEKGTTQKIVTTQYAGLVGKFLIPEEKVFPSRQSIAKESMSPSQTEGGKTVTQTAPQVETPNPTGNTAVNEEKIRQIVLEILAQQNQNQTKTANLQGGEPSLGAATPSAPLSGDTTSPTIVIQGNNPAEITVGSSYVDLGAIFTDNKDDNLTTYTFLNGATTTQGISIDTSVPGTYTVTYTAIDDAGNSASADRTVIVGKATTTDPAPKLEPKPKPNTTVPVITLIGPASVTMTEGDIYVEKGATATDDIDGDISLSIVKNIPIDMTTPGNYRVTYNVSDAAGNMAVEVIRNVTVEALPIPEPTPETATTTTATTTLGI